MDWPMQQLKRKRLHRLAILPVTITAILLMYSFAPPSHLFADNLLTEMSVAEERPAVGERVSRGSHQQQHGREGLPGAGERTGATA